MISPIKSVNFKSREASEYKAWVKHFNHAAASGHIGGFTKPEEKRQLRAFRTSVIPRISEQAAISKIHQAVRELRKGDRREYARMIMYVANAGYEDIVRKILPALLK